jgi:antitoxin component of MazEF toxin-antitoxin module
VRVGDIVIAQAKGGQQVALQVQAQHLINEQIASRGAERWAVVEQLSPELLAEKLSAAHREGKELWGLNVQPLGTYVKGQITPFETPEPVQQVELHPVAVERSSPSVAEQPVPEKPASQRLWEKYSAQNSGVLAAIASNNPQLQENLDRAMADRAIAAGCFPKDVRAAISQHSPQAQKNDQPEVYAKSIVVVPLANVASTGRSQPQIQPQIKAKAKAPTPARREKLRDSGMEL